MRLSLKFTYEFVSRFHLGLPLYLGTYRYSCFCAKHHYRKFWGGEVETNAPCNLDLGTRWRRVFSFMLRPLYFREKSPQYTFDKTGQKDMVVKKSLSVATHFAFGALDFHVGNLQHNLTVS